jgi:hypothetical protein
MLMEVSAASIVSWSDVQERLVDALRLWWRSPGQGTWPFAKDAPWHLMTRRTRLLAADYKQGRELQLHLQREDDEEVRRREGREDWGPLSRAEVATRDATTEWLTWISPDARKVVVAATAQLATGRENVDWRRVKAALGTEIGTKGVYRRYSRALTVIAQRLNGGKASVNGVKVQSLEGCE